MRRKRRSQPLRSGAHCHLQFRESRKSGERAGLNSQPKCRSGSATATEDRDAERRNRVVQITFSPEKVIGARQRECVRCASQAFRCLPAQLSVAPVSAFRSRRRNFTHFQAGLCPENRLLHSILNLSGLPSGRLIPEAI